jgi:hypothetical protein
MDIERIEEIRQIVTHGGGKWVGIQQPLLDDEPEMVLFESPKGALLALPVDEFLTVNSIIRKIEES